MPKVNAASEDILTDRGTLGDELIPSPALSATGTASATLLTEEVGYLRSRAKFLHQDVGQLHRLSHAKEWRVRTSERARVAPTELLNHLSDLGFAWRDIARVANVSVPAVQKWRRGDGITPAARLRLASFVAACDILADAHGIQEVASWLEMRLVPDVPITALDLYLGDRSDLLFDYGSGHTDPEQVLSDFDPDWRNKYTSAFEVFVASDGELSIRARKGDR